jgi:hypothetical protein
MRIARFKVVCARPLAVLSYQVSRFANFANPLAQSSSNQLHPPEVVEMQHAPDYAFRGHYD